MVHGLILCSTFLAGPHSVPMPSETLKELQNTEGLTQEQIIRKNMALAYTKEYLRDHQEEFNQMVSWRLQDNQPLYAYMRQLQAATQFDIEDHLGEIENPTLILHGNLDNIVPVENAQLLKKAIPHAKLIIYKGASHHLFTARADDFNRDVIEFLKEIV
jgi:pimeloyl-ACP methyl ester carboxylesterase